VFHDPDKASNGRRARRAGGITRSRAATVLPFDTPNHLLGDTNQVSVLLADSINRLRRGLERLELAFVKRGEALGFGFKGTKFLDQSALIIEIRRNWNSEVHQRLDW
jgi:hypothetical protein